MNKVLRGRVIRMPFDDVSTDVIAPSAYRAKGGEDRELTELRPHVMAALRPGLDEIVKPGDIFVMGKNYGLGSHRETAVTIFHVWGVQAVVTESAARIWFRNSIAKALPVFQLKDALKLFEEGDQMEIDMNKWSISNLSKKAPANPIEPFPPTVMRIMDAGGMMPLLKQRVEAEFPGQAKA
jgi:3-isopropylmalate/(R)-2-methylmalate dehydratase small subunit